jgi:CheY-like chemotaxis protein
MQAPNSPGAPPVLAEGHCPVLRHFHPIGRIACSCTIVYASSSGGLTNAISLFARGAWRMRIGIAGGPTRTGVVEDEPFLRATGRTNATTDEDYLRMNNVPAATSQNRILVIDDNEIILKTTSMKLQNAGYQVFTALDASEGVSLGRKVKPDLIVLDIGFPPDVYENQVVDGWSGLAWDGFRIMDWLHKVEETKKIPIIFISGLIEEKNRQRATASGAAAFLPKPVNYDEMLKVIRDVLGAGANKAPQS